MNQLMNIQNKKLLWIINLRYVINKIEKDKSEDIFYIVMKTKLNALAMMEDAPIYHKK
jgi:hypothetical protein